jgi:SAM-dependent methyltransferase
MTETVYDSTIDWDRYWADAEDPLTDDANGSTTVVVDPFVEFVDEMGPPDSYADVGCGGGDLAFTVVGYDAAEPVVEANRRRADESDRPDVRFERAVLPSFAPDRRFELVTAFFTLCYVRDVEAALRSLYDAVEPGGHLVVTYHNRYARSVFRTFAADPHEHLSGDSAWDPDHFADRFELVIEGENLLSHERIHDVLGTWPQSVWSVAESERYRAWRHNPLVYVPK